MSGPSTAGSSSQNRGDPGVPRPSDQRLWHPFDPKCAAARSISTLITFELDAPAFFGVAVPCNMCEIGLLAFRVTETTLSKVQKPSLLLAYEVDAVGPILVVKVDQPTASLLLRIVIVATICLLITRHAYVRV
jgi:hypothetical protein